MTPGRRPGGETIAAIATAPGRAALAVLRISGSGADGVAGALLGADPDEREDAAGAVAGLSTPAGLGPRHAELRRIVHPEHGETLDRAIVIWYPSPASYTGEDMLEISCHGGTLVPSLLLDAACAAGARPAAPGEFTRRAYLNGKLDLVQAEAVVDLIEARSPRMGAAAMFALERGLSRRIEGVREKLIELQALIAYDIDFPDEDDGPLDRTRISRAAEDLDGRLDELLRNSAEGELLREGALTVIAGRPNAGKSSLFNALLGIERAIVTEEPGTTRDAIEALASVEGYPFRLVDTAGIRDEADRIEDMGIQVARGYLARADLALVCVEAGRLPVREECEFVDELEGMLGAGRVLVVRTKSDVAAGASSGYVRAEGGSDGTAERTGSREQAQPGNPVEFREIRVSSTEGTGLEELRAALLPAAYGERAAGGEQLLVTRRRHARALLSARSSVEDFRRTWSDGHPPEIAATHLQDAVLALEEILGVVTTDDVLDALFSSFCVGK